MIFNKQQIEDMLRIIDFQHIFFIANNVSKDVLSNEDKTLLRNHGIDTNQIKTEFTTFEQSFYFGKLAAALKDQAKDVTYNDFLKYLRRGQYTPLNASEKAALEYVKRNTYSHIKGLGEKIRQEVDRIIIEEDLKKRREYEGTIRDAVKNAILKRESVKSIVLEIGNKTKDWGRDLGRIAETEMQNAYEWGRAEQILREKGEDAYVYKEVYPQACRYCIKLYLTNGIGSEPKKFKLSQLIANGNNYGKKTADWVATLGALHPYCRCMIHSYLGDDYEWNKEKKMYKLKPYVPKIERKSKIEIQVGDKFYLV